MCLSRACGRREQENVGRMLIGRSGCGGEVSSDGLVA